MFKYVYKIKFISGFFAGIVWECNLNINLHKGETYKKLFATSEFIVLEKYLIS